MTIAGALAGVGAGLYYLSTVAEWNPQVSTALPAIGFNGISAALLACSNPIGTIFSSLFISYITVGGTKLSTQYYTKEIADVIKTKDYKELTDDEKASLIREINQQAKEAAENQILT